MTSACLYSYNNFVSMEPAPAPRLSFSTDFCCVQLQSKSHGVPSSPAASESTNRKRHSVRDEDEEDSEDFEDISFEFSNVINLDDRGDHHHHHHLLLQQQQHLIHPQALHLPSADELFCDGKLRPLGSSNSRFSKNQFPFLESPPHELLHMAASGSYFHETSFDRSNSVEKSVFRKASAQQIRSNRFAMAMAFPTADCENDMLVPLHCQMNIDSSSTAVEQNSGSMRIMAETGYNSSELAALEGMTNLYLNGGNDVHDAARHSSERRSLATEGKTLGFSSRKYINLKNLVEGDAFHDSDRRVAMEGKRRGFSSRKYLNLKTLDEDHDAFDDSDNCLHMEDKPGRFSSRKYENCKSLDEDDMNLKSLTAEDKPKAVSGRKYVNFKTLHVKPGSHKWSSISKSLNSSCSCSPSRSVSQPASKTTPSSPCTVSHALSQKLRTKGATGNKNNIMDLFRLKKCRSYSKEALLEDAVKEKKGSSECKASSGSASFWRLKRSNSSSGKKKSGQTANSVPYPRRNSDSDVASAPSPLTNFTKQSSSIHGSQTLNKHKSLSFRHATTSVLLTGSQTQADNTNPSLLNHDQESHASTFDGLQVNRQAAMSRNSLPINSPVLGTASCQSLQRNLSISERLQDQSKSNTNRYNFQSKGLTGARMDVRVAPVLNMPVCMIPSAKSKILSLGSIFSKKDKTSRGYSKLHHNQNQTGLEP